MNIQTILLALALLAWGVGSLLWMRSRRQKGGCCGCGGSCSGCCAFCGEHAKKA